VPASAAGRGHTDLADELVVVSYGVEVDRWAVAARGADTELETLARICGRRFTGPPTKRIQVTVADWEDVRRLALALPETGEKASYGGAPSWTVKGKGFVWDRPLGRADRAALGDGAPDGPVLGAHVPDLGAKEALLAADPDVYFTIPHFDGYAAVLVRLDRIDVAELEELVVEAWLVRAPKRLAATFLESR
jgi:hypothetical protein